MAAELQGQWLRGLCFWCAPGNMAMATFKVTWFFQDTVDGTGWTENWWCNSTTADAAYASVSNYASVRPRLMLDTSIITQVRVSSIDTPRDSLITSLVGAVGAIAHATYPSAGVWDALLCRRDVAGYNLLGHVFFHQVPAAIFNGRVYNPAGTVSPVWATSLTSYVTEVTNGTYLLRKKTAPGVYSFVPCTQFIGLRRTERRLGRPFDALHGRRATA